MTVARSDGSAHGVTSSEFEAFRLSLSGRILLPSQPDYDDARQIHNGMIDRRPAMIVSCIGQRDVKVTVRYCKDNDLVLSVRCGGHSVAGFSVCEGGVMMDLTPMNQVVVNPSTRTARVAGGATWADIDQATQDHGLATTGGSLLQRALAATPWEEGTAG